jgi:hypothetical protein
LPDKLRAEIFVEMAVKWKHHSKSDISLSDRDRGCPNHQHNPSWTAPERRPAVPGEDGEAKILASYGMFAKGGIMKIPPRSRDSQPRLGFPNRKWPSVGFAIQATNKTSELVAIVG